MSRRTREYDSVDKIRLIWFLTSITLFFTIGVLGENGFWVKQSSTENTIVYSFFLVLLSYPIILMGFGFLYWIRRLQRIGMIDWLEESTRYSLDQLRGRGHYPGWVVAVFSKPSVAKYWQRRIKSCGGRAYIGDYFAPITFTGRRLITPGEQTAIIVPCEDYWEAIDILLANNFGVVSRSKHSSARFYDKKRWLCPFDRPRWFNDTGTGVLMYENLYPYYEKGGRFAKFRKDAESWEQQTYYRILKRRPELIVDL